MHKIWFVNVPARRERFPIFWSTKEDAERYARHLFPSENIDSRYARIFSRDVETWESEND